MSGQLPKGGLLRGVAAADALRQRLLQFSNLGSGLTSIAECLENFLAFFLD